MDAFISFSTAITCSCLLLNSSIVSIVSYYILISDAKKNKKNKNKNLAISNPLQVTRYRLWRQISVKITLPSVYWEGIVVLIGYGCVILGCGIVILRYGCVITMAVD